MPIAPVEGPLSLRGFAWLALALTAALCASIAGFNALVDPTAQLGTGVLEPVAAGPRDRTAKVELLGRDPVPPLVVLGSSRSKKLDPRWLDAPDGVNGAVVGGDLFEARVLAAWLSERWAGFGDGRSTAYPQLVVGVDVEQFRDSSLQGSGFLDVPELAQVARDEAAGSDGSVGDELDRLERLLLTWQVTKASAASVRARVRGGPKPGGAADERVESGFSSTGVPTADAAWEAPGAPQRLSRPTPGAIDRSIAELRATYEANGATVDDGAVDDLRALVRIVHEADGPPPLLYVTPAHPQLAAALDDVGRRERSARVLALLREVARGGRAVVIDCSKCIDPDQSNWIDGTHPSPLGARQLAARLSDELAPAT